VACYRPLSAWQKADGAVVFVERGDCVRALFLPCGQCIGCRLERSRQWAIRCMHEASEHDANCFVTLTYDDDHVPRNGSLDYSHFQKFLKRVRRRFSSARVRFYMCGEYGEQFARPHFHSCLFGLDFPDKVYWSKSPGGARIFRSQILEDLWPFGFSSIGDVTFESAAYVARYCMKKVTGQAAAGHYAVVDTSTGEIFARCPEFNHMSLKPGVGASWISRFRGDVYPHGKVVVRGRECKPPRYYDKRFELMDPVGYEAMQFERELEARERSSDQTDERLRVREKVATAKAGRLKRSIT